MDFIRNRFRSLGSSNLAPYNGFDELHHPQSLTREEFDNLFPRDSDGCLIDVLSQYLNAKSDLVRQRLASLLQDNSSHSGSQFAKLDDSTKIRLLRPRNCQSMSEIADYTAYVQRFIDSLRNDVKSSVEQPSVEQPSVEQPSVEKPSVNQPSA